MGHSRINTANVLTKPQNTALDAILNQTTENTNFLSEYFKNIISKGPSSSRVQAAVNNYREQVVPQLLGSMGEGKSSSALNQALASGAQSLAQNIDADSMAAVQMLQQMTQANAGIGLGTKANAYTQDPSKTQYAAQAFINLIGGGSKIGLLDRLMGRFF